jgi:DNA-directed RNA polymerase specialized sigma24 family protein
MSPQLDREHAIAEFFNAHAHRLHNAVAGHTHGVCNATIEDACQLAWTTRVRRDDVTLDEHGLCWLIPVALREPYRLARGQRTEAPAGGFLPFTRETEPGELSEPAGAARDVDDQVAARIQLAERREDLRQLKPRARHALYLKGLGYSYAEIMALTGASYTAVNRRLAEGRAELRRLARERAQSGQR